MTAPTVSFEAASGVPGVQARVTRSAAAAALDLLAAARLLALPVARGEEQRAAGPQRAGHRRERGAAVGRGRSELPTHSTASKSPLGGSSSHVAHARVDAERAVRATISGLMSDAWAS